MRRWQMLRVQRVSGPRNATVGDRVTYRVDAFSDPAPAAAETARVRWLVKTRDGAALTHTGPVGPELHLNVPDSWAGEIVIVMPYLRSPSTSVSIQSTVAAHAPSAAPPGGRRVQVMRERERFYASVDDEPRFYVGTRVKYEGLRGLMNSPNPHGPRFRPNNYDTLHGQWAWYLWPTITCESRGFFTCLNTYDRARFTFGHIQLAAHTPDDNFVKFFREMLGLQGALEYFPDLKVRGGRIHYVGNGAATPLESKTSTRGLMDYFNSTPDDVDAREAERAARMIDWCTRYPFMSDLQVAFTIREQRRKLREHARQLPLDGVVDKLCLVVMDILHQGRGKYPAIRTALQSNDPFDALLSIGASTYADRIATLRAGIRDLEALGRVGQKVFDKTADDFVVPPGA